MPPHVPPMGTPRSGGTLTVGAVSGGNIETLNPAQATLNGDFVRMYNTYDGLFLVGNGGLQPGLATSAEPNADATVWTLKVRPGVHWHDGKPFTADDVVYTIKSWTRPNSYFAGIAAALIDPAKVRKRGPLTVEVGLTRPIADFPSVTSSPNAYVIQDGTRKFDHPIGTGAFRFESFVAGKSSTHTRNLEHWRGAPHVDSSSWTRASPTTRHA